jgi:glycosyltransferase involved in cell wall biosynthesis
MMIEDMPQTSERPARLCRDEPARGPAPGPAICAVIPVFDHEHAVEAVVRGVLAAGLPCLLVDDGSGPACAAQLRHIASALDTVSLVRLEQNSGKGAAVMAGLDAAASAGYTHAVQIDADGQHRLADLPAFIEASRTTPDALVCGRPLFDRDAPRSRRYGRYLTHVCVWLNTLSFDIPDSMCGFRIYPLAPTLDLVRSTAAVIKRAAPSAIGPRLARYWK